MKWPYPLVAIYIQMLLFLNLSYIPGASDDAVSCALMLEVLRVVASEDKSFRNEIIFLFNGGEESILQVSSHSQYQTRRLFLLKIS